MARGAFHQFQKLGIFIASKRGVSLQRVRIMGGAQGDRKKEEKLQAAEQKRKKPLHCQLFRGTSEKLVEGKCGAPIYSPWARGGRTELRKRSKVERSGVIITVESSPSPQEKAGLQIAGISTTLKEGHDGAKNGKRNFHPSRENALSADKKAVFSRKGTQKKKNGSGIWCSRSQQNTVFLHRGEENPQFSEKNGLLRFLLEGSPHLRTRSPGG